MTVTAGVGFLIAVALLVAALLLAGGERQYSTRAMSASGLLLGIALFVAFVSGRYWG